MDRLFNRPWASLSLSVLSLELNGHFCASVSPPVRLFFYLLFVCFFLPLSPRFYILTPLASRLIGLIHPLKSIVNRWYGTFRTLVAIHASFIVCAEGPMCLVFCNGARN
ncbi:hypothetical protein B0F90DRAFT_1732569 [Multifurca ochricompacta]|uniref:Uncharacterized protein n=1 Tax=Multifurca ochricompacta TaxID=376703 RepID=A0AAD4M225_9AGAM|nr:hypothetical protein B0F90DRAFT_1732569 [Multifurca ochricompacta]